MYIYIYIYIYIYTYFNCSLTRAEICVTCVHVCVYVCILLRVCAYAHESLKKPITLAVYIKTHMFITPNSYVPIETHGFPTPVACAYIHTNILTNIHRSFHLSISTAFYTHSSM